MSTPRSKWPKTRTPLSPEQERISNDFMEYWHRILPKRYGVLDRFGHQYPIMRAARSFSRTLEIGAGLGEHLEYEVLSLEQKASYHAMDIRPNMVARLRARFPDVHAFAGNIEEGLDYPDGHFDRILAIHVLEHLCDLPAAMKEIHRLCEKQNGHLFIIIPCEGGWANSLARKISAQRIFEKRYKQPYRWFIEREHLNQPHEIEQEAKPFFRILHRRFFPFYLPLTDINLAIGMELRPHC